MTQGEGMQSAGVWALRPVADMSQADFHDWQTLLEARTGVVISEQRRAFLQTNLSARMRELGVTDYASYYQQVTDGPRGAVGTGCGGDRCLSDDRQHAGAGIEPDLACS